MLVLFALPLMPPVLSTHRLSQPPLPAVASPLLPHSLPPAQLSCDPRDPIASTPFPAASPSLPTLTALASSPSIPPLYYLHPHPFPLTVQAFLSKYPHPSAPDVVSCHTAVSLTDPVTSVEYRQRVITVRNTLPLAFRAVLRQSLLTFEEESLLDRHSGIMMLCSRNVSYHTVIEATECSKFIRLTDSETAFVQCGRVKAGSIFGVLCGSIEKFAARFVREAGVDAMEILEARLKEMEVQ